MKSWSEFPALWRECFHLAWQSYREGSNPIGALIADETGAVIATGKSAVRAELSNTPVSHCEIAHAELNALLQLDNRIHTKTKAQHYTLYSTLEPCPLCLSALYMSDVKRLAYAARDAFGGSTNLLGASPYMSRKNIEVTGPVAELEELSIFLNVYFNIRQGEQPDNVVHQAFAKDYPAAVSLAATLAGNDSLNIEREVEIETVYEIVANKFNR